MDCVEKLNRFVLAVLEDSGRIPSRSLSFATDFYEQEGLDVRSLRELLHHPDGVLKARVGGMQEEDEEPRLSGHR